jgi:RND family efflux transporter MFP subunit
MKDIIKKVQDFINKLLRRKKLVVVVVLIIILFFGWRYYSNRNGNGIETIEVKKGKVIEELILTGSVQADEHAQLPFGSSGELAWLGVFEGDEVRSGQALARLNTSKLAQDLKIADANLRDAAATLDRVYDDLQGKEDSETFAEKETRTAAETAKDAAVFAHIKAQKDLANAVLKAPFDGIVSSITNPFSGINTLATQAQIEVVNPDTIYFDVSADQSEVVDLSIGQKVVIILDSISDEEVEGVVDFISYTPKTGETGTIYKVKVKFLKEQMDTKIYRIGMTGDAKFVLLEKSDVLYVPVDFVNTDTKGKYVNKGAKNNKVYIEVGLEGEERIEIISEEVKEGDVLYD